MVHSAGLAIIYNNKILLAKPANARWWKSYGIPKGHVEEGELTIDAAIRETEEEIGVKVPKRLIGPERELFYEKKGKPWKKISYYFVPIKSLSDIGLTSETVPATQLQTEEIEWAGFVTFEEARARMIPAMLKILEG